MSRRLASIMARAAQIAPKIAAIGAIGTLGASAYLSSKYSDFSTSVAHSAGAAVPKGVVGFATRNLCIPEIKAKIINIINTNVPEYLRPVFNNESGRLFKEFDAAASSNSIEMPVSYSTNTSVSPYGRNLKSAITNATTNSSLIRGTVVTNVCRPYIIAAVENIALTIKENNPIFSSYVDQFLRGFSTKLPTKLRISSPQTPILSQSQSPSSQIQSPLRGGRKWTRNVRVRRRKSLRRRR